MIIDRGPSSASKRPIIYSSATLTLCGSPPSSPDPFRSPLRQGLFQSAQPPSTLSPTKTASIVLSPTKPAHAETSLSPQKEKTPLITPLENMHLTKIKELEDSIKELTDAVATATAAAEKNASLEAEWRSKAFEAEKKLVDYASVDAEEASSQRNKLVEELKNETALWRRKFDELLEEHSALQSRLESTTAQINLLDKALTTVRSDTADAVAALESTETLLRKKTEEFEAYKLEKEAIVAEAGEKVDEMKKNMVKKEKENEDLTLEKQKLTAQVDSLNGQIDKLTMELSTVLVKAEERDAEKAPVLVTAPNLKEKSDGKGSIGLGDREFLKEKDTNIYSRHPLNAKVPEEDSKIGLTAACTASILEKKGTETLVAVKIQPELQPPPPPAPTTRSHFDAAKALIARTAELEDSLMTFNIERSALETELAKFPSGTAGKTVADRKRKKEIEQRVEVLNKEISTVRLELRKLGIR